MKVLLILALLTTTSLIQTDTNSLPSIMVEDLEGNKINSDTFSNDGKPFAIIFWSTWCSPGKRQLNNIHEVYKDWQEETGIKIIAISTDDARNKRKVAPYIKGKNWRYESYIDVKQDLYREMEIEHPPHTFLFDGNGKLVWEHSGYVDGDEDKLLEQIKKYTL